jgi:imidazolonepropionase
MAVSTDCNPGTAPITSLLTTMNMACVHFRMTPLEVLLGTTRYAAQALGLEQIVGIIQPGMQAELAIWNINHPRELSTRIQAGRWVKTIR